jgi:hypothetical protein
MAAVVANDFVMHEYQMADFYSRLYPSTVLSTSIVLSTILCVGVMYSGEYDDSECASTPGWLKS